MFVYYFTHIPRPFVEIAASLATKPVEWMPGMMDDAYASGDALRTSLGIGRGSRLAKQVRVMVADALSKENRVVLPIRVEAVGPAALFPRLDVDLEAVPVGATMTQLTLRGTYTPPLGQLGALVDRAILHRLAQAIIKNFVEQVAESLATDGKNKQTV